METVRSKGSNGYETPLCSCGGGLGLFAQLGDEVAETVFSSRRVAEDVRRQWDALVAFFDLSSDDGCRREVLDLATDIFVDRVAKDLNLLSLFEAGEEQCGKGFWTRQHIVLEPQGALDMLCRGHYCLLEGGEYLRR